MDQVFIAAYFSQRNGLAQEEKICCACASINPIEHLQVKFERKKNPVIT